MYLSNCNCILPTSAHILQSQQQGHSSLSAAMGMSHVNVFIRPQPQEKLHRS